MKLSDKTEQTRAQPSNVAQPFAPAPRAATGFAAALKRFVPVAIGAGVVYAMLAYIGGVHVLGGVVVVLCACLIYKLRTQSAAVVNDGEAAKINRLHLATVEALATAIDAKDQTTHCHVRRVQIYAEGMGELFRLSDDEVQALHAGALLHDIGKLAVPDHILNKPGELTPAEFDRMKIHTTVGAQILERVGFPYPVAPVVLHHHERWDGRGYPEGLRGEQIPITARILAVVDTFDTVREDRPYRPGMTRDEAGSLLRRGAGTHFDPTVVELFLRHLPRFEAEISEAGIDAPGFTQEEVDVRQLVDGEARAGITGSLSYPAEAGAPQTPQPAYMSQIHDAHREVFALYEIARTFGSSLDVQDVVTLTVNKVGNLVPFDTCAVYLYDEHKGCATVAHAAGLNAEQVRRRTIALGEGVAGFALANRQPITRLDPSLDFQNLELAAGSDYKSVIALPLLRGEQLLGALCVYSLKADHYTDDHLRLLDTVSRLASDALANAVHHAEIESNAMTDALTGLPNARALHVRFEEEAARARRSRRGFQVVMLDLDEFKYVNDTFGHKTGDLLLREIGRVLQAQLREYDFLARYAGDEFVALVQDVDEDGMAELRERIARAVQDFRLHVRGERHARVGISIGTAAFTTHGETLDQLLIVADAAMYSQKADHRRERREQELDGITADADHVTSSAIN